MKTKEIHSRAFSRALQISADHLDQHKSILDNLNVFPVPDGDTGSNMAGTFVPAVRPLIEDSIDSFQDIASCILPPLTQNSRGNSGFILSRFFKGFFSSTEICNTLSLLYLSEGFSKGLYEVNTSLFNPKAGTMVTIIEAMARSLEEYRREDLLEALEEAILSARRALSETPRMLPVLAKAGVIDSGALGFILIFEGILAGLSQRVLPMEEEQQYRFEPDPNAAATMADESNTRQYCVELSIRKEKPVGEGELGEFLQSMGDSIALVNDSEMIKLHIHSDYPEQILEHLQQYGELTRKKVEDMHMQMHSHSSESEDADYAVLAFIPGEGFRPVLEEWGVHYCMVYGKTLPSPADIEFFLEDVKEEHIIMLPNNGNILPSCMALREKSDKQISIIPTSDIIEGISCCYGLSLDNKLQENMTSMKETRYMARALNLYKSSDNRNFDGTLIEENDFFTLQKDKICSTGKDFTETLIKGLTECELDTACSITLFYQMEELKEELDTLTERLNQQYPDLELDCLYGGQHQALIIASIE